MRYQTHKQPAIYALLLVTIAAVFTSDCLTEIGWAEWVLYLAPVALCQLLTRPSAPILVATACSVLLVVGFLISPDNPTVHEIGMYNRTFGFIVVWCVAILTRQVIVSRTALRRKEWLRTAEAQLSEVVRGEQPLGSLSDDVVKFLASYLGAQVGALYVRSAMLLRRSGGFALPGDDEAKREFRVGEGLLGQVATSAKPLRVREVPDGYLPVRSGLGAKEPRELLLAPVTADGELQGVVELGFFSTTDQDDLELLARLSEIIGVALRTVQYRSRLQELLEETQQQAEELQTQQEELRTNNEELEQHTEALREQQVALERQQAELEQTNVQLEEHAQLLVQQKAEVLSAKEELAQKARDLESASRYKSEFLANMSHELRTPLNSSLILAKLLSDNREGNLTGEQVRYAQSIYTAGNDLLELINDILDLSKIEAGMMEVKPELVKVPRLAETLRQMFEPLAREKKLTLSVAVEEGAPSEVVTDAQRLKQVLRNLLANALKFTERGSVSLSVRAKGAGRIAFAVSDTGIGIDPSQHEVIFEAFRQADSGSKRKYGGTGLGLSISRDLGRLLGGDLTVESQPGQGSVFTLELPECFDGQTQQQRQREPQRAARSTSMAAPVLSRRERPLKPYDVADDRDDLDEKSRVILIVEDDAVFAKLLLDLARSVGFRGVVADTADEGFALAVKYRPVGVLLDLHLPDHSGLTVLDRLKATPSTRHIPVQVISAQDSTRAALEMGAVGYMLKPVEREQLLEAMSKLEGKFTERMRSVLVVEDDPVQRESICKLLETSDVRTVAVGTVNDALAQLSSATYDCVVLDLTLPELSGYDLLERMAEDEAFSFPPVIIYTGRSLSKDEEQRLRRYSTSIIIKGARSPERLLDEVTLFLHQVEANLPPDRQRMLAEARSREKAFDGRRVLLVEDDVRNVFALSSVLEQRGAQLRIARNGREALEALEADPDVDIILMDIMMPEMDGLEATRALRKRPELARVPVIAITAKAMRDDQEQCIAAGASDYIAKPVDVEKLLSLMRVWMAR